MPETLQYLEAWWSEGEEAQGKAKARRKRPFTLKARAEAARRLADRVGEHKFKAGAFAELATSL